MADLVQLYRDADVIAVCLADSKFAAGVQVLVEAMACKRPGHYSDSRYRRLFSGPDIAKVVDVGDAAGLREAIVHLVNYPHFSSSKCGLPASLTDAFPPCGLLVLLRLCTARTGFPPSIVSIRMPSVRMFNAALPSRS